MNKGIFFKEFYVTEILQYETFRKWDELKIGVSLTLKKTTADNKKLVEVVMGETAIGVLPESESRLIYDILYNGWDDFFDGYICKKEDTNPQYDQRISVAIYIKKKEANN